MPNLNDLIKKLEEIKDLLTKEKFITWRPQPYINNRSECKNVTKADAFSDDLKVGSPIREKIIANKILDLKSDETYSLINSESNFPLYHIEELQIRFNDGSTYINDHSIDFSLVLQEMVSRYQSLKSDVVIDTKHMVNRLTFNLNTGETYMYRYLIDDGKVNPSNKLGMQYTFVFNLSPLDKVQEVFIRLLPKLYKLREEFYNYSVHISSRSQLHEMCDELLLKFRNEIEK